MEVFKERDKTQERGRVKAGKWTSRFSIRPVPLEYIEGEYEYADISVPIPSPV